MKKSLPFLLILFMLTSVMGTAQETLEISGQDEWQENRYPIRTALSECHNYRF